MSSRQSIFPFNFLGKNMQKTCMEMKHIDLSLKHASMCKRHAVTHVAKMQSVNVALLCVFVCMLLDFKVTMYIYFVEDFVN